MTIDQYIININNRYKLGNSTEHTFRGDLQQLIENIAPGISATNEPKRQKCGAPDYILLKKDIPIGFIEAKDIGDNDLDGLKKTGNKEQFDRYKASLSNLIFTDYLTFHLYRDGQLNSKVSIAEVENGRVISLPNNFEYFTNLLRDFVAYKGQTIKGPKKLAEMMAGKARLLSDVIERSLESDENTLQDSTLKDQMHAFRDILIHDITPNGFADVYAQTIAYGMFAARLHDSTLPTFGRQEAAELIPKSNPFLRKLFGYIAGPDIDDRIKWIVDSLADVFLASNVAEILKDYGSDTKTEDPIIHFYETFLSEYDPKLRKARGVWYTPQPIVNFIVRAVDDILKTEFKIQKGLTDNSKTKIKINLQSTDKRYKDNIKTVEEEVHRVQILDPATGTGTFLAEVIKQIHKGFVQQQGIWSNYVETHLIPRLNGFELLMASYAMAHLKLDLLLNETGFKPSINQRLRVYLTNSLEEHHPDTGTLFANWLSTEANEANRIKRDTPVMCVIGNPPYSVSSNNKSKWIETLIADYKKDLNEQNIQPLSDDYIKFIRFGQHFIEKNGSGILAYISNNSFIDGIIHRQMRKNLLQTFDKIYILDLHGNSRFKENAEFADDKNVFDIMQGVSINIFIKTAAKSKLEYGQIYHSELYGKREFKYDFLQENSISSIPWNKIDLDLHSFYFVEKNIEGIIKYKEGFKIDELFQLFSNGFTTERDGITLQFTDQELKSVVAELINLSEEDFKSKYKLKPDGRDWTYKTAQKDLTNNRGSTLLALYRPFDFRFTYFTGKTKGFYSFPRNEVMQNFVNKDNLGLIIPKQTKDTLGAFVTVSIAGHKSFSAYDKSSVFPLYIYPDVSVIDQTDIFKSNRLPNLNPTIVNLLAKSVGLQFLNEKGTDESTFSPIDILDYIYCILHNPSYRDRYKEFLRIDFPRIPYPKTTEIFWICVKLGKELRRIHLLENEVVEKFISKYSIDGSNLIENVKFQDEKVYINQIQYFENIPKVVWDFYIGGYQPAQKWLKDRKGRKLEFDDILHYQKIIVALSETIRLMKEIDKIPFE